MSCLGDLMQDFWFTFQDRWVGYVLFPVVLFSIMILHEIGHYLVARLFGMPVSGFSIGRGRLMKSWISPHGTNWEFHMFPITGHILIADQVAYRAQEFWKRILVTLAGPAMNFILAFLLFFAFYAAFGKPYGSAIVSGLVVDRPAMNSGLLIGDQVVSVNGDIISGASMWGKRYIRDHVGDDVRLGVLRDGVALDLVVVPALWEYTDAKGFKRSYGYVGADFASGFRKLEWLRSINGQEVDKDDLDAKRKLLLAIDEDRVTIGLEVGHREIQQVLVSMPRDQRSNWEDPDNKYYDAFRMSNRLGREMLPLSLADTAAEAGRQWMRLLENFLSAPYEMFPPDVEKLSPETTPGVLTNFWADNIFRAIFLGALVSLILGVINLLPIPGLDGYHILTDVIEQYAPAKAAVKLKVFGVIGVIAVLYGSVLLSNLGTFEEYLVFKYEKLIEDR